VATKIKLKPTTVIKLKDANLDSKTKKYIEYLARDMDNPKNNLKGQKALDKYLCYTGWYEYSGPNLYSKQRSIEARLARARTLASITRWNY
jgi:hypothetical protein